MRTGKEATVTALNVWTPACPPPACGAVGAATACAASASARRSGPTEPPVRNAPRALTRAPSKSNVFRLH